jgi:hypothetical protein
MSKTITIILSARRPVKIRVDEWPEIAHAAGDSYSGGDPSQYQQALNRGECDEYHLRVRQHADGRALVYGELNAAPFAWGEPAKGEDRRGGVLLDVDDDLIAAIRGVGEECQLPDHVIRECIANLPAEEI